MKCPECRFENREGAKFCLKCGARLAYIKCPHCGKPLPIGAGFCDECGQKIDGVIATEETLNSVKGERKHVTALFSDLSGYTAMSERLDPEEVEEIMRRIIGEIRQVISKYDGFIEKFAGDAVLALFGVPAVHEDDPVRAIRAAREIHDLVRALSPHYEEKVGRPLCMHTGINTGLVVTGDVNMEKGVHGLAGDTINVASRLCSIAGADEIMVGQETSRQSEQHFNFEVRGPTKVKGRAEPVQAYRLLSIKERPYMRHRPSGLKADLIGRKVELIQLKESVKRLKRGLGSVFAVVGDAGTGKSRLVEEFKTALDLDEIQWFDSYAYAYTQNIPYYPVIDLLTRCWKIEESDPSEIVRQKVEAGMARLTGNGADVLPYIGSLFSLNYPEAENVSPEIWQSRLNEATLEFLSAAVQKAPTIFCLEDIHWADPSTIGLIRSIITGFRHPALLIYLYRPPFSLFTSDQFKGLGRIHHEIRLHDLSASEAEDMAESLLNITSIPIELRQLIWDKAEGNPFYLEELVNSLIESQTLVSDRDGWQLAKPINELKIPSTINGIISARLDRLGRETKHILQEASVIGRTFLFDILNRVTEFKGEIDRLLIGLERIDLLRTRSLQPHLEFSFKHALTQEVSYNSLLKKDRQRIHKRVADMLEDLFRDRLAEFYETLAFHYKRGNSVHKAVDYLVKSGEKSLTRYALEESHQYFKEAFELLAHRQDKGGREGEIIIDLLIKWSFVYYYRGNYKGLLDLLTSHKDLAESLADRARLGMFYAWLGCALWHRERFKESYQYLNLAIQFGEETEDDQVIGYACAWLSWICTELGLTDKAIHYAERAQEIYRASKPDQYIYFNSMAGMGYALWHRGDKRKTWEVGENLLKFGQRHANVRSMVMGYCCKGWSHLIEGELSAATSCFRNAVRISTDPWYSQFPKLALCYGYVLCGKVEDSQTQIQEILEFSRSSGAEFLGAPAHFFEGVLLMAEGRLAQGMRVLEDRLRAWQESGSKLRYAECGYVLAKVYSHFAGPVETPRSADAREKEDLQVRRRLSDGREAEIQFNRAIEIAEQIGAKCITGQAYLNLGLLYKGTGNTEGAKTCLSRAVQIFEQCEAKAHLKEAREALAL